MFRLRMGGGAAAMTAGAGGLAEASPSVHRRPRARPSLQSSAGQGFESS
jgi:hypothetical protein